MATMKAVQIHEYGGPDVLKYEDVPRPKPKSGEILVRIYAASVNPIDLMMRNGDASVMVPHLPYILGWDLAGVVEQVGAGVEGYVPGDAVYANVGPNGGCYAEYAAIPAFVAAHKPASLDFVAAASVPLVALTAWQSLFEVAGLSAGQRRRSARLVREDPKTRAGQGYQRVFSYDYAGEWCVVCPRPTLDDRRRRGR